ncbi:MAG: MlaD family protein [Actinomycetota bacterium]|nr:MlaD family protein [Actinomycetota bacterium]
MRRVLAAVTVLLIAVGVFISTGFSNSHPRVYLVRAIFDDASFAVTGEDVRVAGANVGTIQSLGVTADKRAAVTIAITDPGFEPFHADAHCAIRPQSLIGEEYVDCDPGRVGVPTLTAITHGPGSGSHYLSVMRTSSPIDSDIVQNISTQPVRQSLALIINEFGTGLAARGSDLNAAIRRANPALGATDRVVQILAHQNRVLAALARDSDRVLSPLAVVRRHLAGFVTQANATSVASATRARSTSATFRLFPRFLARLRPLMGDLGALTQQGTPLMTSLGQSATAVGRQFASLTPFAVQARRALINLGASAAESQPSLIATQPLANRLLRLGTSGAPAAALLDRLTRSLDRTGAIEQLMNLLYSGAVAGNGLNSLGHFLRAEPLVSSCTSYLTHPLAGCSANFAGAGTSRPAATRAAAVMNRVVVAAVQTAQPKAAPGSNLQGLLGYLLGSRR